MLIYCQRTNILDCTVENDQLAFVFVLTKEEEKKRIRRREKEHCEKKKEKKQVMNDLDRGFLLICLFVFVIFPAHDFFSQVFPITIRLQHVDDDHDRPIHYDHQSYISSYDCHRHH